MSEALSVNTLMIRLAAASAPISPPRRPLRLLACGGDRVVAVNARRRVQGAVFGDSCGGSQQHFDGERNGCLIRRYPVEMIRPASMGVICDGSFADDCGGFVGVSPSSS